MKTITPERLLQGISHWKLLLGTGLLDNGENLCKNLALMVIEALPMKVRVHLADFIQCLHSLGLGHCQLIIRYVGQQRLHTRWPVRMKYVLLTKVGCECNEGGPSAKLFGQIQQRARFVTFVDLKELVCDVDWHAQIDYEMGRHVLEIHQALMH